MKNDDASKLKRSLAIMAAAIVKICNAPNQVDHPDIEFKKFLKLFFLVFEPLKNQLSKAELAVFGSLRQ